MAAGFSVQRTGTYGTYSLDSTNGANVPGQGPSLSVGAPFSVSSQVKSGAGVTNITKINISYNGGYSILLAKDPNTQQVLTSYYSTSGTVGGSNTLPPTDYNYFPSSQIFNLSNPSPGLTVYFYAALRAIALGGTLADDLFFDVTYDNNVNKTDYISWQITFQCPNMTMSFVQPDASHQFAWAPYRRWYKDDTGKKIYEWLRISIWNDINYINGVFGVEYDFGASTAGLPPWHISGLGTNNTSSDGVFYAIQLGYIQSSSSEWYEPIPYEYVTSVIPDSPKYPNLSSIPCLDGDPTNPGPGQWPWSWGPVTQATAGGGQLSVPPPNTVTDPNGNTVTYYYDAPSSGWQDVSPTRSDGSPGPLSTYYKNYYLLTLFSYMVFHPTDGIPVGLTTTTWYVAVQQDNSKAKVSLSWMDGRTDSGNWAGFCYAEPAPGTTPQITNGPFYMAWPDTLANYVLKPGVTRVKRGVPVSGGGANVSPMGGGAMGGAPAMQSPYGAPYPKARIANLGGMN